MKEHEGPTAEGSEGMMHAWDRGPGPWSGSPATRRVGCASARGRQPMFAARRRRDRRVGGSRSRRGCDAFVEAAGASPASARSGYLLMRCAGVRQPACVAPRNRRWSPWLSASPG